ncbi:MAG: general stress protein CsbD [Actinobacteria bacterium 21-73-9]|nr:MAG: general stress protein CsbD [Actinobacteria bacterium 21-73-9]
MRGAEVRTKNKVRNAARVVKGRAQEAAGRAVGNDRMVARGKSEQVKGHLRQAGEKARDAFTE